MLHLLKIEWLKMKSYSAFVVLASFFGIGVIAANYLTYNLNKTIADASGAAGPAGSMIPSFSPYDFSHTWQTTSYATGWILILPAMLLIILTTNEFTYRTNRQNIIDGLSRNQFTSVKLMLAVLFAAAATVLVFFTALLFGFIFSHSSFGFKGIAHVGFFFLKALSYNMIAILISVLIRKTGFAIAVFFIYFGAENIISQLLDAWSRKIKFEGGPDLGAMGDYLPMSASDGLLTFPDSTFKDVAKMALPTNYTWLVFSIALVYLVLFFFFSKRRMLKSDL